MSLHTSFSTHPDDERTMTDNPQNSPVIPSPSPPEPPSPNPTPPPPQQVKVPDLSPNLSPYNSHVADYPASSPGPLDGHSLILVGDDNTISSINTDYHTLHMRTQGLDPEIQHAGYHEPISPMGTPRQTQQNHDASPNPEMARLPRTLDIKTKTASPTKEAPKQNDESCLPQWLVEAPFWLKLVIVTSIALLLGAMVLIGVAASLEVQNREDETRNNAAVSPPTLAPENIFPTQPNLAPTKIPLTAEPTVSPIEEMPPWQPYNTSTSVQFFVAGGLFAGETLRRLPDELSNLPNIDGNTVLFHLGDWNAPSQTECQESAYSDIATLFSNSSLPVYFIVGDNEFNDCPDPKEAFGFWEDYLLDFETEHWPAPKLWNIARPDKYSENFGFLHRNVLILGINLVGGVVHDNKEWQKRHAANLEWINSNYFDNEARFDTMVVLAHADPEILANESFFLSFFRLVRDVYSEKQVVFIHRNLGSDSWGLETAYDGITNLMVAVVEGTVWPPMLVTIDTAAGILEIDQRQWYYEYKAGGIE